MGNSMCARKLKILYGDKCDGCGRNASVYHVYPVSRTTSDKRAECSKVGGGEGGFPTALGRIDVYPLGACYTRGARSRRWCGWWGRRVRWGALGGESPTYILYDDTPQ